MGREASTDQAEWKDLKQNLKSKSGTESANNGARPLSEAWVKEAFNLSTNETLKDKPELMSRLVDVLASHGPAFEGGPHHQKETGQTEASCTLWVTAKVELKE